MPTLRRVYGIQVAVVVFCAVGLGLVDRKQVIPFLAGAGLITVNFVLLAAMWRGVFEKKHVARHILIVVIKYAILGALLYIFVRQLSFPLLPLFVGVSTLGVSFIFAALQTQRQESSN